VARPAPRATSHRYLWAAVVLALPVSQLGHAFAYGFRFGPAAAAIESQGIHAYFPALIHASAGILGLLLVVGLLTLAILRLLLRVALGLRPGEGWPLLRVTAVLLAVQVAIFFGQETIEAVAAGEPPPNLGNLVWLGLLGQLPAACLTGLALNWISTALETAFRELRSSRAEQLSGPPAAAEVTLVGFPDLAGILAETASSAFTKRGPPPTSLPEHS
jgi:hypothetical protein